MARVLIIGASKGIGLETTRQALEAGHLVRALSRSAAASGLSNPNLEKVRGNALESRDVERGLDPGPGVEGLEREVDADAEGGGAGVQLGVLGDLGLAGIRERLAHAGPGGRGEYHVPVLYGQGDGHLLLLLLGVARARDRREIHHGGAVLRWESSADACFDLTTYHILLCLFIVKKKSIKL